MFGERIRQAIGRERIPISGSLELTFQCNLRCKHCYLDGVHDGVPDQQELTMQEWYSILDQLADEGTLWLLLTGGEPLVRPDFLDIYTYAKRKGFLITLFTNGTTLTPEIVDYLVEWRPFNIEITLYGRTKETYESVTGIPGSFDRCMRGIELLRERQLPFALKAMVLTLNAHELWDIKSYAEDELGVKFRFDANVHAGVDKDFTPEKYRLQPEEIVEFDLLDAKRMRNWQDYWEHVRDLEIDSSYRYICGAGLNMYNIDPFGRLSVCMLSREENYDLRAGTFSEGWHDFLPTVRFQKVKGNYQCNRCELKALCHQCTGWSLTENGDPEELVEFLCRLGHVRAEKFEFV